jgi:hypothetical protein
MGLFTLAFSAFAYTALGIWRPDKKTPFADRVAWTAFAFGVYGMVFMAGYGLLSEGEGWGVRSWEAVRRHRRLFLAFAAVAASGLLTAFAQQARGRFRPGPRP